MSSNATEGARPPAAPAGEAPAAEEAWVAPAEAVPAAAALAERGLATAAPAEGALDTAAPAEAAVDTAAPVEGAVDRAAPAEGAVDRAAPAEGAVDTAAPVEGAVDRAAPAEVALGTVAQAERGPEPEPGPESGFTESGYGFAEPGYGEPGYGEPGYGEPGYGEPGYGEPGSAPVSKLAILALVSGLVALVPVAVASGVAALVGIRRTGRSGHGMAMAGLFLSAAWVIIGVAIGTVGVVTHGFHKPVTVKYREAAVFMLHEGDCVDSPNAQLVSILPCSIPHEAEVFATFALPTSPWPGKTAIATEASSGCGSRLNGYLNPQLAVSLTQSYVYPDQVAWTAGTRTVVCEVRASSGDLTGSVRGATLAEH
jgi:hypothetical protein